MQATDKVTAFQANNNSMIQINPTTRKEAEWVNQQRKGHELHNRTDTVNSDHILSNCFTISRKKICHISKIFWSKQYFQSMAIDVHPPLKIMETKRLKITEWLGYQNDSNISHSSLLAASND